MSRLDKDRELALTPIRIEKAMSEIAALGYNPTVFGKSIRFTFKDAMIVYYPYSGWATGKTIKDGRGLENLLKQIR